MKKQLILIFFFVLFCYIVSDTIEAKAGEKNSLFEYETKSLGNGTCRITEIRIKKDKGISMLRVPNTINGEIVVSIGPGMIDEKNEDRILQNVFLLSTYADHGNPYKYQKDWHYKLRSWYYKPSHDQQKIRAMKIKKIILPDCITEIKEDCFAMLKGLKKIKLPKNLTVIGHNSFAGTPNLKTIHLRANVKDGVINMAKTGFPWKSFTISSQNPYYKMKKGCILSKNGRIFYSPAKIKDIRIPDSVTTIEQRTFYNCTIKSLYLGARVKKVKTNALCTKNRCHITLSPLNPYLAKSVQCIYYKKNKEIIAGIPKKRILKISNRIKVINNDGFSIVGMTPPLRKLYIPKSVKKLPPNWNTLLHWGNTGCKIYYKNKLLS